MANHERHEFSASPSARVFSLIATEGADVTYLRETAGIVSNWNEMRLLVHEAVEALPEPYRTIIEGVYWEQATYDEIAARIGCAHRSTVMRRKREAEAMLRRSLEVSGCRTMWMQHCSKVRRSSRTAQSRT